VVGRARDQLDRYWRSFLRIAELGSFTKAADILGLSQPALSKQVKALEDALGVDLFRRTTRGVRLTPQGEFLLERLRSAFDGIDQAVLELDRGTPCLQGEIVIGAIETFSFIDRLWDLVTTMSSENPSLSVGINTFSSSIIVNKVCTGEYDFGIVHENADFPPDTGRRCSSGETRSDLLASSFRRDVITAYPDWPKSLSLISFGPGSALGRLVRNHNRSHGIPITIETNSVQYLLDATARGLGVTILPELFPIASTRDHDLARCLSPKLTTVRGNVLIQRRRGGLSPQATALLQRVLSMVPAGRQEPER
jgi:DNA-binding transcriptional LysR family regulator